MFSILCFSGFSLSLDCLVCFVLVLFASVEFGLVMAALWYRAGHYIFALWFLSISYLLFFPRLISAVADWMSTILPHTVWPYCEFRMQV